MPSSHSPYWIRPRGLLVRESWWQRLKTRTTAVKEQQAVGWPAELRAERETPIPGSPRPGCAQGWVAAGGEHPQNPAGLTGLCCNPSLGRELPPGHTERTLGVSHLL